MKANKFMTYTVCFNPFDIDTATQIKNNVIPATTSQEGNIYILDDITELTLSKEAENTIEELKELDIVVIEIPA